MHSALQEGATSLSPDSLAERLRGEPGLVVLRGACSGAASGRYSILTARPFLTFRSWGSRCELASADRTLIRFGNPWRILDDLLARYELLDEPDLPFPLGGCFGYWGYDLKNHLEPKLSRRAVNDLALPDCHLGFHDSLVVFDDALGRSWIVSTGLAADGGRSGERAGQAAEFWHQALGDRRPGTDAPNPGLCPSASRPDAERPDGDIGVPVGEVSGLGSTFTRSGFLEAVARVQAYIRAGDIYQVNLSQRLAGSWAGSGWDLYRRLQDVSPAPLAAYLDAGDFELASSSPELFLRISGAHVRTRPIKGTRPRSADPTRDAQLSYELQTSPKEMAELVMITDLLRNDLGRVCEYGTVQVPELVRLERFAQVQHLVSTVEGRLRPEVSHIAALAAGFPGGSVTGAPKFRAMEIIDELEPTARGPYTGALGYIGFNRESQLSIVIRTALCRAGRAWFPAGAGIVADSDPAAEYEETLAKARGFLAALEPGPQRGEAGDPVSDAFRGVARRPAGEGFDL